MDKKGRFSRRIVIYCIIYMSMLILASFVILAYTGYDASGLLSVAGAFLGGELMLLCLKRVFAKPSTPTDENNADTTDDDAVGGK